MSLVRIAAPTVEPLTVDEAKRHLRIDADLYDDDDLVSGLIAAAREWVEQYTHRALLEQTWRLVLDTFPCTDVIDLPVPNLIALTSFTYVDTSGATQAVDPAIYAVDANAFPGRIVLGYARYWPYTLSVRNAVTVEWTAGYGATADTVPQPIRAAMKLLVSHLYENREPVNIGNTTTPLPFSIEALLAPYRLLEAA